jgi:anti-sigma B factor antagonist
LAAVQRRRFEVEHLAMEDGAAVVAVHGELDLATSGTLCSIVSLLGQIHGAVVVDLAGVDFCDTAGLHALNVAQDHLTSVRARLVLRRPTPRLHRLLEVTGYAETLNLEPTAEAAHYRSHPTVDTVPT